MKKFVWSLIGVGTRIIGGSSVSKFTNMNTGLSDIALKNIEAISTPEATCTFSKVQMNSETNKLICEGTGSLCCRMG